jgi:hypothetical protein
MVLGITLLGNYSDGDETSYTPVHQVLSAQILVFNPTFTLFLCVCQIGLANSERLTLLSVWFLISYLTMK